MAEETARAAKKPKLSHLPAGAGECGDSSAGAARFPEPKEVEFDRATDVGYIVAKLVGEIFECTADGEKIAAVLECYRNVLCGTDRRTESGTGLLSAVRMGDARIVRFMLAKGVSPFYNNNAGETPLSVACESGHLAIAALLFGLSQDSSARAFNSVSPLCAAASAGHLQIVDWLLKAGVDVVSPDRSGRTPLMAAAGGGYTRIVERLLAAGAGPCLRRYDVNGARVTCARNGQLTVLKYLVEHGIEQTYEHGLLVNTLLAAVEGNHEDVVRYIIETKEFTQADAIVSLPVAIEAKNAKVAELLIRAQAEFRTSSTVFQEKKALYLACKAQMFDTVRLMFSYGVGGELSLLCSGFKVMHVLAEVGDVEMMALAKSYIGDDVNINALACAEKGVYHCTPLAVASANGHVDAVRFLLAEFSETINVNPAEFDTASPLAVAAENGNLEIVELLLSNGANVNAGSYRWGPLFKAATAGHVNVVRVLAQRGAVVNPPPGSDSALYTAVKNRRLDVIACLIDECGADTSHREADGFVALDVAVEHVDVLRLMLSCGCVPEPSTLCLAALCGSVDAVEELMLYGADANAKYSTHTDRWDLVLTPLMAAALSGQREIVTCLCDYGADANLTSNQNETALHLAAMQTSLAVVDSLVSDESADISATTALGFTSWEIATANGFFEAQDTLEEYGNAGGDERLLEIDDAHRMQDRPSIAHWERQEMWHTFLSEYVQCSRIGGMHREHDDW